MNEPTASYIDMGNLNELTLHKFAKTDSFQKFMNDFGLTKVDSGRAHICEHKAKKLVIYHGMGSIGWSGFGVPAIIKNNVTHLVTQKNDLYSVIKIPTINLKSIDYKNTRIILTGNAIYKPEPLCKTDLTVVDYKDFGEFLGGTQ